MNTELIFSQRHGNTFIFHWRPLHEVFLLQYHLEFYFLRCRTLLTVSFHLSAFCKLSQVWLSWHSLFLLSALEKFPQSLHCSFTLYYRYSVIHISGYAA